MGDGPGQDPPARSQRLLRAILPIGIALLVAWIVWLVIEIAIGDTQRGFSWVSAALGLATSLILIASGISYRRALRRS